MTMDQVKTIRNGERAPPTFSPAEMQSRLRRLRDGMLELAIDAALFTSLHNICYFADFLYCAFGRHYGLVVGHDTTTTISANIDGGQPWRRTFGNNVVYTDWQRGNYFVAVEQLLPNLGRIGIEYDHVSVEALAKLKAVLPDAEFVDIAPMATRMRMVKSPQREGR